MHQGERLVPADQNDSLPLSLKDTNRAELSPIIYSSNNADSISTLTNHNYALVLEL